MEPHKNVPSYLQIGAVFDSSCRGVAGSRSQDSEPLHVLLSPWPRLGWVPTSLPSFCPPALASTSPPPAARGIAPIPSPRAFRHSSSRCLCDCPPESGNALTHSCPARAPWCMVGGASLNTCLVGSRMQLPRPWKVIREKRRAHLGKRGALVTAVFTVYCENGFTRTRSI